MYLVREAEAAFNPVMGNIDIKGYKYTSEKILTKQQLIEDEDSSKAILAKLVLDSPVVINNQRQFHELYYMFRSDLLVFYCDPEVHGREQYQKMLETA